MPMIKDIKNEPKIRVGIILPEDKISFIKIEIPKNKKYKLKDTEYSGELVIKSESNSILLNDNSFNEIKLIASDQKDYLIIDSVPAGRGFHWQKFVITKLPGNIIIKNIIGNIFLINELPLEKYLPYVATAEMNPDCPIALLEAQTIAARSWLMANLKANHPDLDIDVCNDDCCQRYQGIVDVPQSSLQAIENTYGQFVIYNDEICDARYSKSCGGITESFENVWGGEPINYLSSLPDLPQKEQNKFKDVEINEFINSEPVAFCSPHFVKSYDIEKYLGIVDKSDSYYRWKVELTQNELISTLNKKLNLDVKHISNLKPLKRGFSGRISKMQIDYIDKSNIERSIILNSEYDIRNALHKKFLFSSAIYIEQIKDSNRHIEKFIFNGAGWGHGVGLCQIGALGMALDGYSSNDILKHYFQGTDIKKLY